MPQNLRGRRPRSFSGGGSEGVQRGSRGGPEGVQISVNY